MGTHAQRRLTAAVFFCLLGLVVSSSYGQVNPVPFVNQPLVPTAVAPGGNLVALQVFVPRVLKLAPIQVDAGSGSLWRLLCRLGPIAPVL